MENFFLEKIVSELKSFGLFMTNNSYFTHLVVLDIDWRTGECNLEHLNKQSTEIILHTQAFENTIQHTLMKSHCQLLALSQSSFSHNLFNYLQNNPYLQ